MNSEINAQFIIASDHLQQLLDALRGAGYRVIGPTARDGAIVYDDVTAVSALPAGWTDEQDAGFYRLRPRADGAWFGYTSAPQSWKRFLQPPSTRLWQAQRNDGGNGSGGGFAIIPDTAAPPRLALLGVRPCELRAIAIQDQVFLGGAFSDRVYRQRREGLLVVAVNCTQPGGTCFCASMQTGPAAQSGFDLALTEIVTAERHDFVVAVGSEAGAALLEQVTHREATAADIGEAARLVEAAAQQMGRTLDTTNLKEKLYDTYEHPHWDAVAARCLTCGNCTLVCPTCFCMTVEDTTDLTGSQAESRRVWDSCFTMDFSHIHGGSVRYSARARYRQWLMHKLATWQDQFGTFGCVGCGRCITWCPVGIDITEEVRALQHSRSGKKE